jgi:peroxiredoxin
VGIGLLDTREACQVFVRRHGLTFPNGYDGEGKIAKLYGFSYQPWWAVIAKDGTLQRTGFGPSGEKELVSTIKTLVRQ